MLDHVCVLFNSLIQMGEPIVEPVPPPKSEFALGSIFAALILGLIIVFLFFLKFFKGKPKNTFLLVGLSDSGKTQIYSKLIKRGGIYFILNV